MPDKEGQNRISLRIPEDLFRELEDKRHAERTTFQEVGIGLFRQWLGGKAEPVKSHDEDPDVEMLRRFKEIGSPEDVKFLRGNILVFLRDAEHRRKRKGQ